MADLIARRLCLGASALIATGLFSVSIPSAAIANEPFSANSSVDARRCLKIKIPGVPCPTVNGERSDRDLAGLLLRFHLNKLLPQKVGHERYVINPGLRDGQQFPPTDVEVRVGMKVRSDCNHIALRGALKPFTEVKSDRYQFWSLQGPNAGELISTVMWCADRTTVERQVWLSGPPVVAVWRGQFTVVDLPEGWTLQWRRPGEGSWTTAKPLP